MARRIRGATVESVYSTPHSQNAWAQLFGGTVVTGTALPVASPGTWFKIQELSPDGVTNTFDILVTAQQGAGTVEVETTDTTTGEKISRVWKPDSI
ncbi:MAG TPA: hypothetical protein VFQ77_18590 [Pseudonocardiaceae bacterium]|jgi:hypothetical protein|nr:hypothetical protein [Pseudonocardiaceae bacterium]